MLFSVDHAVGIARDLADRLSLRFANSSTINTIAQSQDGNGYPIIVATHAGSAAEGQPVVWIRFTNIDVGAKDIFGNSTLPFTPTLAQIAYELNSTGAPIPTTADFSTCLSEIARTGCVISEYAIANGTAVTEAAVNAASPIQTLKDIDNGFKGNT